MSTTVFNYDGSVRTVINDASIDTTTDLQLPGTNYQSYGSSICSDLVMLLQNFSSNDAPTKPVIGQLWFRPMYKDNSGNSYEYNRLLVYTNQTESDSLDPSDPNKIVPTGWTDIGTKIYTNISGPITKEIGDIWIYDQKQVYWNGSKWQQLGGAIISHTAPTYIDGVSTPDDGTTWFMIPEGMLWIYDSTISSPSPAFYRLDGSQLTGSWKLIGPQSPADIQTGNYWTQVPDTSGGIHNVFVTQVDGKIVSVSSSEDFDMDTTSPRSLQNFSTYGNKEEPDSPNMIHKGINVNQYYGFTLDGTVTNSLFLNGLSSSDFLGRGTNSVGITTPTTPYTDNSTNLGSSTIRWSNMYSYMYYASEFNSTDDVDKISWPCTNDDINFMGIAYKAIACVTALNANVAGAWESSTTVDMTGDISANEISINSNEKLTFTTDITDQGYDNIRNRLLPDGLYVFHSEYDPEVSHLQSEIDAISTVIGPTSLISPPDTILDEIHNIKEEIGNTYDSNDSTIYGQLNDHATHLGRLDNEYRQQEQLIISIEPGRLLTRPASIYNIPGSYTYNIPDGVNWLHVKGCAGGGAGGAGLSTNNPSSVGQSAGTGGGAGASAEFWVDISKLSSRTFNITVGSGGVPNPNGTGGNGGDSSFGQWIRLGGGYGGPSGELRSSGVYFSGQGAGGQCNVYDSRPLSIVFTKFGQTAQGGLVINGEAFPSIGADGPFGSGGYQVEDSAGNGSTGFGSGGAGGGGDQQGSEPGGYGMPGMWSIAGYS